MAGMLCWCVSPPPLEPPAAFSFKPHLPPPPCRRSCRWWWLTTARTAWTCPKTWPAWRQSCCDRPLQRSRRCQTTAACVRDATHCTKGGGSGGGTAAPHSCCVALVLLLVLYSCILHFAFHFAFHFTFITIYSICNIDKLQHSMRRAALPASWRPRPEAKPNTDWRTSTPKDCLDNAANCACGMPTRGGTRRQLTATIGDLPNTLLIQCLGRLEQAERCAWEAQAAEAQAAGAGSAGEVLRAAASLGSRRQPCQSSLLIAFLQAGQRGPCVQALCSTELRARAAAGPAS